MDRCLAFIIFCREKMNDEALNSSDLQQDLYSSSEVIPTRLNNTFKDFYRHHHRNIPKFIDQDVVSQYSNFKNQRFQTTLPRDSQPFQHGLLYGNSQQSLNVQNEYGKSQQTKRKRLTNRQSPTRRVFQQISTKLDEKRKWHKCKVGRRFQTKNICNYLFKETANYLKMMGTINQLTGEMKEIVGQFLQKKNRINLNAFNQLFRCLQLRQRCLEYYESNEFVCSIFRSRADLKTKLRILKYLQKIRRIPLTLGTLKWKE